MMRVLNEPIYGAFPVVLLLLEKTLWTDEENGVEGCFSAECSQFRQNVLWLLR